MPTKQLSVRVEAKLKARLEREAKRRDRTVSYVANRAIKLYFEQLDQVSSDLDEAFAEADKGVFISGGKIVAWMESWGTEGELPPPEPDIFPEPKRKRKAA